MKTITLPKELQQKKEIHYEDLRIEEIAELSRRGDLIAREMMEDYLNDCGF